MFGILITMGIITFNLILKKSIIRMIVWVGYDSRSEQLTRITNWVFIA